MSDTNNSRHKRSQQAAIMMAVAVIPRSFQRSLLPRSTVDQGVITTLTVVMVYLLGLITQDVVDLIAGTLTNQDKKNQKGSLDANKVAFIASGIAVGLGIFMQRKNPYHSEEKLSRSATRTSGYWLQNAGIAGLIMGAVGAGNYLLSDDKQKAKQRDLLPYFMAAGLLFGLVSEYTRSRKGENFSLKSSLMGAKPARTLGISLAVAVVLAGLVYSERFVARRVDRVLDRTAPQLKRGWLPVGHMVGVGTLAAGMYLLLKRTYNKIEHSAEELEAGFTDKPKTTYKSGGPASAILWNSLSIQGRRHVATRLPADEITKVVKEPAKEPIRIFVGLDSAASDTDRVALALSELDRTGAFDRSCILVVSPTGTGYVNYVMSEAVEYLARGDVASVTIQYSKRPSPMSLDRVDEGHVQYRMLLNGIKKRLLTMPEKSRPRVMLFGESLGAWTSQDSVVHEGTDGLQALLIDRALWIGTPKGSKWKEQVTSNRHLNTEPGLVGIFDNYSELQALSEQDKASLRYIMVTHYNDPISQFGLEMLIKQPEWVSDESKRPEGMSSSIKYRTPTLFVQTLIDMKNALKPIPGEFVASGHDYRADLADFVAFSYGFQASAKQLAAIEAALRNNEVVREARIKAEA